jgi:hypothetical protein
VFCVMRNRSLPSRWSSTRARWEAFGSIWPGGTLQCGAGSPASRLVQTPLGPRKSGMPESVLMPAPVKATMCSHSTIHRAIVPMCSSRRFTFAYRLLRCLGYSIDQNTLQRIAEFRERLLPQRWGQTGRTPRYLLGTSPWPFRHGWRPCPSATGAVGLPGGGDPILLVYRPAAVRLLHARLGHVHPTKSVGLADIHPLSTFCLMIAILPCLDRPGTEIRRALLT